MSIVVALNKIALVTGRYVITVMMLLHYVGMSLDCDILIVLLYSPLNTYNKYIYMCVCIHMCIHM